MEGSFRDKDNYLNYYFSEYREQGGGSGSAALDKQTFRFDIAGDDSVYDLSNAYLQMTGTFKQSDGTTVINGGEIAFLNSGWSYFDEFKLKMNNQLVSQINDPGEVHQVHGLINYSKDYEIGQGTKQMWAPDRGNGLINNNTSIIQATSFTTGGAVDATSNGKLYTTNDGYIRLVGNSTAANQKIELYVNGRMVHLLNVDSDPKVRIHLQSSDAGGTGIKAIGGANGNTLELRDGDGTKINITGANGEPCTISITNDGTEDRVELVELTGGTAANLQGKETLYATPVDYEAQNSGFEKRRRKGTIGDGTYYNNRIDINLKLRDICKFLKDRPMLTTALPIRIELQRQSQAADYILCDATVAANNPKFVPDQMKLWVPVVTMDTPIMTEFYRSLEGQKSISWYEYNYTYKPGQSLSSSNNINMLSLSALPRRCFVWFTEDDVYGDYEKNPRIFENFKISHINIKVSNKSYPEEDFDINFEEGTNQDYTRVYEAYLRACHLDNDYDCTPAVSYEEFKDLYPLFCFEIWAINPRIFSISSNYQIQLEFNSNDTNITYRAHLVWEERNRIDMNFANRRINKFSVYRGVNE